MVSRDTRGRVKGYKRLFDVGMEIEQSGESMGYTSSFRSPTWLEAVGGSGWIHDGSGPMEFSLTPAKKNLASMFKRFADGIPVEKRWEWKNAIPYGHNRSGSGCGSHIHFGTKQRVRDDVDGKSLAQITIFYNTAVTLLPFCTKWFSWGGGNKLRMSWSQWAGISGLQRYSQETVRSRLSMSRGREGSYSNRYGGRGFMLWNRRTKDKCTVELRVNEAMPQWCLPFVDVFLDMTNMHIKDGDSPKLKNHRSTMEKIHNDLKRNNKLTDTLDDYIEFYEGRELLAPKTHIIGKKFPRRMKVREFIHLIDRVCYWVFAYSSRKLYRNQLRFRALGGDPSRLPKSLAWEPWNYTVEQMFQRSGQTMPTGAWIRENFPKVVKRTHTPSAHVRLGDNRLPVVEEETVPVIVEPEPEPEPVDTLHDLIDRYGTDVTELSTVSDPRMNVTIELDGYGLETPNIFRGCTSHRAALRHACEDCLEAHNVLTGKGYPCAYCIDKTASRALDMGLTATADYTCHHGELVMRARLTSTAMDTVQLTGDGCMQCMRATHNHSGCEYAVGTGDRCVSCMSKTYVYLRRVNILVMETMDRQEAM